jgi:hypothetical protein
MNTISRNPLFLDTHLPVIPGVTYPCLYLHRSYMHLLSPLTESTFGQKCYEVAKRVTLLALTIFAYPCLFTLSLVGRFKYQAIYKEHIQQVINQAGERALESLNEENLKTLSESSYLTPEDKIFLETASDLHAFQLGRRNNFCKLALTLLETPTIVSSFNKQMGFKIRLTAQGEDTYKKRMIAREIKLLLPSIPNLEEFEKNFSLLEELNQYEIKQEDRQIKADLIEFLNLILKIKSSSFKASTSSEQFKEAFDQIKELHARYPQPNQTLVDLHNRYIKYVVTLI